MFFLKFWFSGGRSSNRCFGNIEEGIVFFWLGNEKEDFIEERIFEMGY